MFGEGWVGAMNEGKFWGFAWELWSECKMLESDAAEKTLLNKFQKIFEIQKENVIQNNVWTKY